MASEIIGKMKCTLCGNVCDVKSSSDKRVTMVCKWQDDGCGSQLQALCRDSADRMKAKMVKASPESKAQSQKIEPKKPEPEKVEGKKTASGFGFL